VDEAIFQVGLPVALADRKPHEVSGGQRQRFAIARALIVRPSVIVCDEIVSALDVLVQATVLNIVKDRTEKSAMGLLFVSHGLPATAFISEELAVMKMGRIVEQGTTNRVLTRAEHPSAMELISAYHDLASNLSVQRRASQVT
jgi:peptide/nickel transport system ATP-binding protein